MIRACNHCQTNLVRSSKESRSAFADRQHCNRACSDGRKQTLLLQSKGPCEHCGAPLIRKAGEAASNFRKRKTCGVECGRARQYVAKAIQAERRNARVRAKRAADRAAARAAGAPTLESTPRTVRQNSEFNVNLARLNITNMRAERHQTHHMRVLGTPCEIHPSEMKGFYGCVSCNSSKRWRAEQHQVKGRPTTDARRFT